MALEHSEAEDVSSLLTMLFEVLLKEGPVK